MKKNTLYNLDAISKYSIYSNVNLNYDRILGDRSLKGFVKINKKPKLMKQLNYLEEIHQKYPNALKEKEKKDPHEFINQLILKKSDNNKNDSINNKYYKIFKTQQNDKPQKLSIKDYFTSKKNKYQEVVSLDPFKYNPNYNAIYKKIPYVRIVGPKEHKENTLSNNKSNKKNRIKRYSSNAQRINNSNESENNANDSNSIDSKSFKDKNMTENNNINLIKLPKLNINKNTIRNDNHALRFSKYGNQRKFYTDKNNENENENDSNILNNKINNHSVSTDKLNVKKLVTINFDKMTSRKETDFINNYSLKNPSFNRYSPNYDFIKNSPAKISFSYHHIDNNDKKKLLLRKILASYKVDTEFHIINNNEISHNNSSKSIDK